MTRFLSLALALFFLFPQSSVISANDAPDKTAVSSSQAMQAEGATAKTSRKRIALTFDDGPHPYRTDKILSLLAAMRIPATFFVVGQNAALYPAPLRRAVAAGHEIGNHTYSHPKLAGLSQASLAEELRKTDEIIKEVTGKAPTLFRPPEGVRSRQVTAAAEAGGYSLVLWTIDTRDWAGSSAAHIAREILQNARDGAIILCHDYTSGKNYTVEGLTEAIPALLAQGYEFVTVSDLLGL